MLLFAAVVLIHESARAESGGGDTVVVEEYDGSGNPCKFKDITGESKLIYSLVSGTKTVKITDWEHDATSTSYVTFPNSIVYGGDEYTVVGNQAILDSTTDNTYIDSDGVFKLKYQIKSADNRTVQITNYSYDGSDPVPVVFPAKVTIDGTEYTVVGDYIGEAFRKAPISDLTVIVSSPTYSLWPAFMYNNSNLKSLKFIVDNDNPENEGCVVLYQGAFQNCTSLTSLMLPNAIRLLDFGQSSYPIFAGCTSLGSTATSENPFVFNTKLSSDRPLFSECKNIKYLELGKNVNEISSVFNPYSYGDVQYLGCPDIDIIYNTSKNLTEEDIAKSIIGSGSDKVYLFNFSGGELTKGATISDTGSFKLTMPQATIGSVNIPSWSHKDGTAVYSSGTEYSSSDELWSTDKYDYSYYYYTLYANITVTYNVTYTDSNGMTVENQQKQEVVCMYNTHLYDRSTYPDSTVANLFPSNFKWTSFSNITYLPGQSVTLNGDLELYLFLDSSTSRPITITYEWNYVDYNTSPISIIPYTYSVSATSGTEVQLISAKTFIEKTNADSKFLMYTEWIAQDGSAYELKNTEGTTTATFYGDVTLTAASVIFQREVHYYIDDEKSVDRYFIRPATYVTISTNFFYKEGYSFQYWQSTTGEDQYYPGQEIIGLPLRAAIFLYAVWSEEAEEVVTINYKPSPTSEETIPKEYTYGSSDKLYQDMSKKGYALIGWSYTGNQTVNFPIDTEVTMLSNLQLYPVWAESPTIIVNDILISENEIPSDGFTWDYVFIGKLDDGDTLKPTWTIKNSSGKTVTNPTSPGVYYISIKYQVEDINGTDVTKKYCSKLSNKYATDNCYSGILTIYNGEHSIVID